MIEKYNCRQIGQIVKTHGINGEIVIRLFDEFTIEDLDTKFLFLDLNGGLVPFFVEEAREKNNTDILTKLELIKTDDDALAIMDAPVYTEKKDTDENKSEDNFSAYQLIGYNCYTTEHDSIGEITAIRDISKNPLFEIINGDNEILIPIVDEFIAGIDDIKREIIFRLPDGLLDLE